MDPEHSAADSTSHDTLDTDEQDNDGLGYYPDGVKRTLTDEQIAMFRHSEIHSLLRARQLAAEQRANSSSASPEPQVVHMASKGKHKQSASEAGYDKNMEAARPEEDDEEREYQAFLVREREDLAQGNGRDDVEEVLDYSDTQIAAPATAAEAVHPGDSAHSTPGMVEGAPISTPDAMGGRKRLWYGDLDEEDSAERAAVVQAAERTFIWPKIGE